jgi:hypothetical protein
MAYVRAPPLDCHHRAGCAYSRTANGVYRCDAHGHDHACGATRCDSRFIGGDTQVTCGRTGRWLGSALAPSPFAVVPRGPLPLAAAAVKTSTSPASRDPFRPSVRAQQDGRARGLIAVLLGGRLRRALARTKRKKAMAAARNTVDRHARAAERAGVAPDAAVARRACDVAAAAAGNPLPSPETLALHEDGWVRSVMGAWARLGGSSYGRGHATHVRFLDVALAVLYLRAGGGVAWPGADGFFLGPCGVLGGTLPRFTDLHHLRVDVKGFTRGKNHLYRGWRSEAS